jgi:pimeloyl-ACP methyl ester carboxylesterase
LDGTARLFDPFVSLAPAGVVVSCFALPNDAPRNYEQLAAWVIERLPDERVVLVAESFSGPLAVMVANRCPQIAAVVLCASFIVPPVKLSAVWLPSFLWHRPPPAFFIRLLLTGGDRALAESVRRAVADAPGDVIADRVATVLRVDVRDELAALDRPLLCLKATRDRIVRVDSTATIRALKADAELVDIDAPHLLLQSNPRAAWEVIAPFLARVTDG